MGGSSSSLSETLSLSVPRASLCDVKPESPVHQQMLESSVFSRGFRPSAVEQSSPSTLMVYGQEFEAFKKLGSGSYGAVHLYKGTSNNVYLAIKFADSDDEGRISEALLKSGCQTLRVQSVGVKLINPSTSLPQYAYFMELAEGTLDKFVTKLEEQNSSVPLSLTLTQFKDIYLYIGEQIRKQMLCLYDLSFTSMSLGLLDIDDKPIVKGTYVYLDLKPQNVLYKCDNQMKLDEVRFFLGDLGGAVPDEEDGFYVSTYPPIEHKTSGGFVQLPTPFDKEAAMSWELGVLLLYLAFPDLPEIDYLTFNNIPTIDQSQYDMLYNRMSIFYGSDIAHLLHADPAKRRDIRNSLLDTGASQKRKRDDAEPAKKRARVY